MAAFMYHYSELFGIDPSTLFGVFRGVETPKRRRVSRPLLKPVAIPERNAIQFCNAQPQQIEGLAERCEIVRLLRDTAVF
jgi:hypothetical protein